MCEIFPERTSCNARKKKYFIAHYQVQKRDEIYQVSQNCITETFLPWEAYKIRIIFHYTMWQIMMPDVRLLWSEVGNLKHIVTTFCGKELIIDKIYRWIVSRTSRVLSIWYLVVQYWYDMPLKKYDSYDSLSLF